MSPTDSNVLVHDTASPPKTLPFYSDDASPCARAVTESAMPDHFKENLPETLELVPRAMCLLRENIIVGLRQPPKPPKLGSVPALCTVKAPSNPLEFQDTLRSEPVPFTKLLQSMPVCSPSENP